MDLMSYGMALYVVVWGKRLIVRLCQSGGYEALANEVLGKG